MEEWGAMKEAGATGLPIWEEDGFTMTQSNAILRMVGIRNNFYHTDPQVCYSIDSLLDFHEDIIEKHGKYIFPKVVMG